MKVNHSSPKFGLICLKSELALACKIRGYNFQFFIFVYFPNIPWARQIWPPTGIMYDLNYSVASANYSLDHLEKRGKFNLESSDGSHYYWKDLRKEPPFYTVSHMGSVKHCDVLENHVLSFFKVTSYFFTCMKGNA